MGKKVGCNFEDRNRIAEWVAAGKTAAEISELVGVEQAAVEHHMPKVEPPKPKPKKKDES